MCQKVSIVVPIYKVEKYLRRCVDSILNQTYKSIQVILVDDGSPDSCGKIADEYSEKDSRVKAVHKLNGGLSDARNYGMQYVTGEFVLFVDSDDWLANQMIEVMVDRSLEFKADVVQAAFYYAYDEYLLFDDRYYPEDMDPIVLDNPALMSELVMNERVKNFAWGKLYKTGIIKDIPFKRGVLFEDVFWAHSVMQKVSTYAILNQPMYYYYQRSDSIASTYTLRSLDIIKGLKERHCFIEKYYSHLTDESYKLILKTSLIHYNLLVLNKHKDSSHICRKEIQLYIKDNFEKLMKAVKDDRQLKQQLYLFRIFPPLNISVLIINKILRKLKIIQQPIGLKHIDFEKPHLKG